MKKKEKKVLVLKKTRKAYLIEYLCGIFLLILLAIFHFKGIKINVGAEYFVFGLSLFSIGSAEVSRLMHRYEFSDSKLTIVDGLIKQHKKHVSYYAIGFVTGINVKRNRIQRLLNYGTISVENSGESAFKIKDIDRPGEIMKKIEKFIDESRKKIHKAQEDAHKL